MPAKKSTLKKKVIKKTIETKSAIPLTTIVLFAIFILATLVSIKCIRAIQNLNYIQPEIQNIQIDQTTTPAVKSTTKSVK